MTSPYQFDLRSDLFGISSTDMRAIVRGEWAGLYDNKIWQATGGEEGVAPTDLTWVWKPALGRCTEGLHRQFLGRQLEMNLSSPPSGPNGELMAISGKAIPDATQNDDPNGGRMPIFFTSNDGWLTDDPSTLTELKHTNSRNTLDGLVADYGPQIQWQMMVTGARRTILSGIFGNDEPKHCTVDRSDEMISRLLTLATSFWSAVSMRERPMDLSPDPVIKAAKAKVVIDDMKAYDYSVNNEWVSAGLDYTSTKNAHDKHKKADKELRAMIPADARIVTGAGITAKRDARGAMRFSID